MKITEAEVIQQGEKELMDAITGELDWNVIEKIFKEKHNLLLEDDVEYKRGDMIVHNQEIAYKLDFNVKVTLSVLCDRQGNSISVISDIDASAEDIAKEAKTEENKDEIKEENNDENNEENKDEIKDGDGDNKLDESKAKEDEPEKSEDLINDESKKDVVQESNTVNSSNDISQMASNIGDMIGEINEK